MSEKELRSYLDGDLVCKHPSMNLVIKKDELEDKELGFITHKYCRIPYYGVSLVPLIPLLVFGTMMLIRIFL